MSLPTIILRRIRTPFMPVILLLLLGVTGAEAQVVTNTADSGPGTLRSAITNAVNGEIITFAPSLSGATITLDSTLTIDTNLTIDASALPGGIQINGNDSVQIFSVASGVTNFFNSLTLINGSTEIVGGAIKTEGTVTLNQCTLSKNRAGDNGGGIANYVGTLTLNQCTLSSNSASAISGGGIFNSLGTVIVNQCTLSGNSAESYGGGISTGYGYVIVNQCTLSGNSAVLYMGGGLSGPATVTNSIIAGNYSYFGMNTYGGADIANYGATNSETNAVIYGGSNIVQSVSGFVTGPAPLTNAPNLAPLGNYGGPTQTMPPLPGSPAIGAGSVTANIFTTDQRGYPREQNGLVDIGAVELPTVPPFTASITNGTIPLSVQFTSADVDSDGSAITGWTWSFGDRTTNTTEEPTHVYSLPGIFTPGLVLTNSLGLALAVPGPDIATYPPPTLTGISWLGTNLMLAGNEGVSGAMYYVLTSTNPALPLSQWTPLVTNIWGANGNFNLILTNALDPAVPQQFYLIKAP